MCRIHNNTINPQQQRQHGCNLYGNASSVVARSYAVDISDNGQHGRMNSNDSNCPRLMRFKLDNSYVQPLCFLNDYVYINSPPSLAQVAHSLQPPPPHCSPRPSRPPRPPPTILPPARLHRSGNARCPCWRKTPPTLTWSPTRMTHTCSVPSPPPRKTMMQVKATPYTVQIGCQRVGVFVLIFHMTLIIRRKVKGAANHHSQSTLRPPLPPPHNHHTLSHQSANSLNRNTLRGGRNPIHAPAPGTGDGPTTPESVQLQDSWVLNSNVPLETRHFLFKTSSGTTPLFSSSSPGYPLTSGTVYSPPPRLLPRNTFSRSAFKLKKPSKYCSWKCAAVTAIAAAALLAILLSYFIAINLLGLTWQLKPSDGPVLNNGLGAGLPVKSDVATLPSGGRGPWAGRNSSIDTGNIEVRKTRDPRSPSRSVLEFLKFNISLGKDALFGVYIRKGLPPSHAQYDYMERLDGKEKWSVVESPRERRSIQTVVLNEAVFVQYLDAGAWHLAFYNDGREREAVSFSTNIRCKSARAIAMVTESAILACAIASQDSTAWTAPKVLAAFGKMCFSFSRLLIRRAVAFRVPCEQSTAKEQEEENGARPKPLNHSIRPFGGESVGLAACPVLCSGNGQYDKGSCVCYSGWKGPECDVPVTQCIDPLCSGHGTCTDGNCVCSIGYKGPSCAEGLSARTSATGMGPSYQTLGCAAVTPTGWDLTALWRCVQLIVGPTECVWVELAVVRRAGPARAVTSVCATRSASNTEPARTGSASVTRAGTESTAPSTMGAWLTKQIRGASLNDNSPTCSALPIYSGALQLRGQLSLSLDVLWDGLTDCMDPDCCIQSPCQNSPLCRGSRDPLQVIQQSPMSQPRVRSFYDRVKMLVGRDSTHILPGENPFNSSLASLIRGQVLTTDGTPLVGVNVSFVNYPHYGYTLTRQDGMFDLIANGGASLTLRFERAPFLSQERTVWLPWSQFYAMDTLVLKTEENTIPGCDLSGFVRPDPLVIASPLSSFFSSKPGEKPIIPETQVLHEQIEVPGTSLKLCYLSSRTQGYRSLLKVTMTPAVVSMGLLKVHLMVAVEGHLFQKWFHASPNLAYTYIWDKTDAYGQRVYGLSEAVVSVGYEYESCASLILWEKRTAILQGYELDPTSLGGWSLDKHHILNTRSGILHKGSGENIFVTEQPPVITSIMGNGRRRSISCPSCNGLADGNKLLAPVALAMGIDGSLYVGDLNFVRRVYPSMNTTGILELSNNPTHKYFLAVDPVSGALFISDTNSRRIYRVRSLTGGRLLSDNAEVVAGTGEQCLPFDERCGDGGKATEATLMSPKGIAVDKNGLMYFVDATMIRKVDQNGIISTLLGANDLTAVRPLSCDSSMDVSQVRLEWPTDLAVNPMDNSLYVLENNVILRITENHQVSIIAGRPMHCQVPGIDYSLSKLAIHAALESATAIALSHTGILYIAETDEKKINRVRQVSTNGEISLLAGTPSDCDCKNDVNCNCFYGDDGYAPDAGLNSPTSLAVSPDGTLFIADLNNIRIRAVRANRPGPAVSSVGYGGFAQYEVASPREQELYVFNGEGLHIQTISLVTGEPLYNFTYGPDGELAMLVDNCNNTVKVRRDGLGPRRRSWLAQTGAAARESSGDPRTGPHGYDSEGRLTNVTYPTGMVTSLHREIERSINIDIESSSRDDDVTVITNLSSVEASYTVVQGPKRERVVDVFSDPPALREEKGRVAHRALITGVQQAAERHNQAFMALEGRLLNKERRRRKDKPGHWFGTSTPIIGRGVMLALKEGRVVADTEGTGTKAETKPLQRVQPLQPHINRGHHKNNDKHGNVKGRPIL
ncbi:Teneurin-2 [Collichthys lucidus]|uniref:Teneurin-2 n=1 Tax=Collichthys lucidus TaxID=240159 RepID=A0A4U5UDG9_COLLU|nr:Teneurin-2 [Collichthys lucidus]